MLPLHTLLNQLTTLQSLKVENLLQQTVNFDSKSLLVFNSMLLGQTAEEIKAECYLSDENYPKYERPIYNCILELYNLQPKSAKDNILTDAYYAVHETIHEDDNTKASILESIFHQLKKHQIEQESVSLLLELHKLHLGTPLQAVYHHLYDKYKKIQEANNTVFELFECLNKKLTSFLNTKENDAQIKSMILDYKSIRKINIESENNTSKAIYNLSKLMLSSIANQKQLLKEDNVTELELMELCCIQIDGLPFGVEQYFMQNIFEQIALLKNDKRHLLQNNLSNSEDRSDRFLKSYNFSFPNDVYESITPENVKITVTNTKNRKNTGKRFQKDFNLSKAVDRTINSFSFSGDSWSITSA